MKRHNMRWGDMIWLDQRRYEVRRGDIWFNRIWGDVMWYDTVRFELIRYKTIKDGVIWWYMTRPYETRQGEAIWYQTRRDKTRGYDTIRYTMIQYEARRYKMIQYEAKWGDAMWCEMRRELARQEETICLEVASFSVYIDIFFGALGSFVQEVYTQVKHVHVWHIFIDIQNMSTSHNHYTDHSTSSHSVLSQQHPDCGLASDKTDVYNYCLACCI